MAIDFPNSPVQGLTYDYLGVRYTYVDTGGGTGFWKVNTPGSVGAASAAEVDEGVLQTKYVTPFSLEGSKYNNPIQAPIADSVGGGPEVLKDWTTVTGLSTDLLTGIAMTDLEGLVIEFKDLRGAGGLGLDLFVNGSSSPIANGYSKVVLQAKSYDYGEIISGTDQRLLLKDTNYYEGSGKVSLRGSSEVWPHGISLSYNSDMEFTNSTPAVVKVMNLVTMYQLGVTTISSLSAILTGTADAFGIFSAKYRIVRNG